MIKPPKIAPEILFRTLLELPRPIKKISFRLNQAKEVPLLVKAFSSEELANTITLCEREKINLDSQILVSNLILINNKPAFSSVDKLKNIITMTEYDTLLRQVSQVLDEISPTFSTSDQDAWMSLLKKGANHPSNSLLVHSLGSCYTPHVIGEKLLILDKPQEYFGVPKNQLLDGHWMAYIAARFIYQKRSS